jgi:hypothetical protein
MLFFGGSRIQDMDLIPYLCTELKPLNVKAGKSAGATLCSGASDWLTFGARPEWYGRHQERSFSVLEIIVKFFSV